MAPACVGRVRSVGRRDRVRLPQPVAADCRSRLATRMGLPCLLGAMPVDSVCRTNLPSSGSRLRLPDWDRFAAREDQVARLTCRTSSACRTGCFPIAGSVIVDLIGKQPPVRGLGMHLRQDDLRYVSGWARYASARAPVSDQVSAGTLLRRPRHGGDRKSSWRQGYRHNPQSVSGHCTCRRNRNLAISPSSLETVHGWTAAAPATQIPTLPSEGSGCKCSRQSGKVQDQPISAGRHGRTLPGRHHSRTDRWGTVFVGRLLRIQNVRYEMRKASRSCRRGTG